MISPDTSPRAAAVERVAQALRGGESVLLVGAAASGMRTLVERIASATGDRTAVTLLGAPIDGIPLGPFLAFLDELDASSGPDADDRRMASAHARLVALGTAAVVVPEFARLDPGSVALLRELGRGGIRFVAGSVDGEPLEGAPAALLTECDPVVVELPPLDEDDVRSAVRRQLDVDADARLVRALLDRAAGDSTRLQLLIAAARTEHALVTVDGTALLATALPQLPGLEQGRLATLDPAVRRAVGLVALGEPLPLPLARELMGDALTVAARLDLVQVSTAPPEVRLARAGLRDEIDAATTALRRSELLGELIGAAGRLERRGSLLSLMTVRWRRERGDVVGADELMAAAATAAAIAPGFEIELIRAAVGAGAGADAELRLVELELGEGRIEAASRMLDLIDRGRRTPEQSRRSAELRVRLLAGPAQRPDVADQLLDRISMREGDAASIRALRVLVRARRGLVADAAAMGTALLEDESAPVDVRIGAGVATANALLYLGSRAEFGSARLRLGALVAQAREPARTDRLALAVLDAAGTLMLGGSVHDSRRAARTGYLAALDAGDDDARAECAGEWGWAEVLAGDLDVALRLLREAHAARRLRALGALPWVRSLLVTALALSGSIPAAERLLARLTDEPRSAVYDTDVDLAAAAVLAASGRLSAAARRSREAAVVARSRDFGYLARVHDYAAVRYGDLGAAAELLAALSAPRTPTDLAIAAHVEAIAQGDPIGLEQAATELRRCGFRWYAAEAQALAAVLHRRHRRRLAADLADARLEVLLGEMPSLRSPVVAALHRPALTTREREAMRLAATGLPDRDIAARMGVSVRTVTTHLSRVYGKLGIPGRVALEPLLWPDPP